MNNTVKYSAIQTFTQNLEKIPKTDLVPYLLSTGIGKKAGLCRKAEPRKDIYSGA